MLLNTPLAFLDYTALKTESGQHCELPLKYDGKVYDSCIGIDNGGVPWCYINHSKQTWENCETDHIGTKGEEKISVSQNNSTDELISEGQDTVTEATKNLLA